jgi:hypothetical protein
MPKVVGPAAFDIGRVAVAKSPCGGLFLTTQEPATNHSSIPPTEVTFIPRSQKRPRSSLKRDAKTRRCVPPRVDLTWRTYAARGGGPRCHFCSGPITCLWTVRGFPGIDRTLKVHAQKKFRTSFSGQSTCVSPAARNF